MLIEIVFIAGQVATADTGNIGMRILNKTVVGN